MRWHVLRRLRPTGSLSNTFEEAKSAFLQRVVMKPMHVAGSLAKISYLPSSTHSSQCPSYSSLCSSFPFSSSPHFSYQIDRQRVCQNVICIFPLRGQPVWVFIDKSQCRANVNSKGRLMEVCTKVIAHLCKESQVAVVQWLEGAVSAMRWWTPVSTVGQRTN